MNISRREKISVLKNCFLCSLFRLDASLGLASIIWILLILLQCILCILWKESSWWMKRILISNVLERVPTSTSKSVWESRSTMRPLWLPSALLGTSEPHGAVVAGDVVSQLLLSTGREADRAGVHSAPVGVVLHRVEPGPRPHVLF